VVGTINAAAAEWIEAGREEPFCASAPAIRAIFEQLLVPAGHA
jgi:hypothetical protein